MNRRVAQQLAHIANRSARCDCSRIATHLDSHKEYECDYCRVMNQRVRAWHERHREAMEMLAQECEG